MGDACLVKRSELRLGGGRGVGGKLHFVKVHTGLARFVVDYNGLYVRCSIKPVYRRFSFFFSTVWSTRTSAKLAVNKAPALFISIRAFDDL